MHLSGAEAVRLQVVGFSSPSRCCNRKPGKVGSCRLPPLSNGSLPAYVAMAPRLEEPSAWHFLWMRDLPPDGKDDNFESALD